MLNICKPSGTTSLALRTSSGVHEWHAPFYIRRQKFHKGEAIYAFLKGALPDLVVDDAENPNETGVLEIPVRAPEGAIVSGQEDAIGLLERVGRLNREWIKSGHREGDNRHNVSCTISYDPSELDSIKQWMWDNRRDYGGIALFPRFDADHPQLPFEAISEDVYNEMLSHLHDIDLTQIIEDEDDTDLQGEIACGGGGCEVT